MTDQDQKTRECADSVSPAPAMDKEDEEMTSLNMFARPRMNAAGQVDWDLDNNPSPQIDTKLPIVLPVKGGKHEIVFHIVPASGLDFEFDSNDPIWTADNSDCPPAQGDNSTQIDVVDCKPKKLTITNENSGAARLVRYQLNFVNKGTGPASSACDPAILNGGGGRL